LHVVLHYVILFYPCYKYYIPPHQIVNYVILLQKP